MTARFDFASFDSEIADVIDIAPDRPSLPPAGPCGPCVEGEHWGCRPDRWPCGCARENHRDKRWPFGGDAA